MTTLADIAIIAIFAVILLQLCRPATLETHELQVWSDDVERRLLKK